MKVIDSLLHLWLSLITFMVIQFVTFVFKFHYIYGKFYRLLVCLVSELQRQTWLRVLLREEYKRDKNKKIINPLRHLLPESTVLSVMLMCNVSYYIYGKYYIYGQFLFHLWVVLHFWFLLHLWVIQSLQ